MIWKISAQWSEKYRPKDGNNKKSLKKKKLFWPDRPMFWHPKGNTTSFYFRPYCRHKIHWDMRTWSDFSSLARVYKKKHYDPWHSGLLSLKRLSLQFNNYISQVYNVQTSASRYEFSLSKEPKFSLIYKAYCTRTSHTAKAGTNTVNLNLNMHLFQFLH